MARKTWKRLDISIGVTTSDNGTVDDRNVKNNNINYTSSSPSLSTSSSPVQLNPTETAELTDKFAQHLHSVPTLVQRGYHFFDAATYRSRRAAKHPLEQFQPSPARNPVRPGRAIVAIDCENVGADNNLSEVVRVSAVDVLTGEDLLDVYVQPYARVRQWRTRWSGVTPAVLRDARRRRNIVNGWDRARAAVWRFVDSDTIVVGHALQGDLEVLRMAHTRVVDTSVMTWQASAAAGNKRQFSLKDLAREFTDMKNIQQGSNGHCSLEDARATAKVAMALVKDPKTMGRWVSQFATVEDSVWPVWGWDDGYVYSSEPEPEPK